MYGKPKTVKTRAVFNSEKVKVVVRKILKNSKPKKVKIGFTLKPKHFSEGTEISENSFQILLKKLSKMNHAAFVAENFGVNVSEND